MNFEAFSQANRQRCESPDGFNHALNSWSRSDWLTAFFGEAGEAANVAKKLNRIRDGIPGNKHTEAELRAMLKRELADSFIYLDLAAQSEGFSLEEAVVETFNAKSAEIGYPVVLTSSASREADYAVNLGKEAYEAYCRHTGWKPLATGADLPQWADLRDEIRQAWMVTAAWVVGRVLRINGIMDPMPVTSA